MPSSGKLVYDPRHSSDKYTQQIQIMQWFNTIHLRVLSLFAVAKVSEGTDDLLHVGLISLLVREIANLSR
ncbi:UNVERIFIED_CONTAM: hypothetical protein FKN15_032708 [Acipenser sinensis]